MTAPAELPVAIDRSPENTRDLPIRGLVRVLPWSTVFVASLLFRWPALVNAAALNSDAAIVGLQAKHMLSGEWSPFLYGSGYQTSVDAAVAASLFVIGGATPLALMLSALLGHLVVTGLVFTMLRRHLRPWTSAALCAFLVFTTCSVHTYALWPPRQTSITLAFAALWLLTAEATRVATHVRIAGAACVAMLAAYADPYALVFLPPLAVLVLLRINADRPRARVLLTRACFATGGALVGVLPLWLLWRSRGAPPEQVTLTLIALRQRAHLLAHVCLPAVLGMRLVTGTIGAGGLRVIQYAGAFTWVAAIALGTRSLSDKTLPLGLRFLVLFALLTTATTLTGFLLSPCAVDFFSNRYLASVELVLPFLFAPLGFAAEQRRRAFLFALAPLAVSSGVAGWVAFPFVDGAKVRPFSGADEQRVETILREHGVRGALANYWLAYRLTFLFDEREIVVPRFPVTDRYPPYRAYVRAQRDIAYVLDKTWGEDQGPSFDAYLASLTNRSERYDAGRYVVVVLHRADDHRPQAL